MSISGADDVDVDLTALDVDWGAQGDPIQPVDPDGAVQPPTVSIEQAIDASGLGTISVEAPSSPLWPKGARFWASMRPRGSKWWARRAPSETSRTPSLSGSCSRLWPRSV
jgi:hypothetical protein